MHTVYKFCVIPIFGRFQSCHSVAMEALSVLKLRAEYELLTTAIQVNIVGVCTSTRIHIKYSHFSECKLGVCPSSK